MNDLSCVEELLPLFDDDSQWCDPYPLCYQGFAQISKQIRSLPIGTQSLMLSEPMVANGAVAGFLSTLSFSFPGEAPGCLYTDDQHVSWRLRGGGDGAPKLDYLRWVFNPSVLQDSLRSCGLSSRPHTAGGGTEGEVRAVHDYVLPIMYSPQTFHLICDIIAPDGRYCDPYPERCVIGPDACRSNFGDHSSGQARPASIRPLMITGPSTGAFFVHFSTASRSGSTVRGLKLVHQTFALWTLANTTGRAASAGAPTPLLSNWEWFY